LKIIFNICLWTILLFVELPAQVTGLNGWNIFLDPGHSQTANMGAYGYSEAERNLRVALRLKEMLLETTDIDTVFISRTNDTQVVSLSQRTSYANSVGAAWFHSIHSNAPSTTSNSTLLLWGQYYNGEEKVPHGGKVMADIMVDILTRGMRATTIGSIGDCSFYTWSDWCQRSGGPYLHVNRETTMPSELSESGYHTNPKQNQLFMSDRWKILEAKTFYWSILKLFGIERPPVATVTGEITDFETGVPANGVVVTINNQKDTTDTFESLFYKYAADPYLLHNGFYYLENLPHENLQMIVESDFFYGDTLEIIPSDTFFTFKDFRLINKVPPKVIQSNPASSEINVEPWENITLIFNRKMNRQTVQENLEITPNINFSFFWSGGDTKVILKTDTLSYLTEYTLKISNSAVDRYNHPFDGNGDGIGGDDFTLNFKTGSPDRVAPNVTSIHPPNGMENVEVPFIINLEFDEKINPETLSDDNFKLKCVPTALYVKGEFSHHYVNNKSVLSFFPKDEILPGTKYAARLFPGVKDISGNEMEGYETFGFTTTNKHYETTIIDSFEGNFLDNWWAPTQSGLTVGVVQDCTYNANNEIHVNLLSQSTKSLQLNYGWDLSAEDWFIRMYLDDSDPKNVFFDKNYLLHCYVFGDGNGNKIRFCVDDNVPNYESYNHEVSPWYTIDWFGWKLLTWDMSTDSIGTWLGDGNLNGTLGFDSFQMTHDSLGWEFGNIYIDDLMVQKELTSSVDLNEDNTGMNFYLAQNYPNPFNPETTIQFQIARESHTKIIIYNLLGHQVKVLTDKTYQPGVFELTWNGKNEHGKKVPSGIYFYRMETDGFVDVKKMLVLE
jgi:N-acetylmuramoyl-L-alanine amidase